MKPVHPLILATTSSARRQMMENAGLSFHFQAPEVNEDAVRQANAGLDANSMAQLLADTKALSIIAQESIIIAADQTLEIDGAILTKTRSIAEARQQLIALRGQTHYLHSAVSCARDEKNFPPYRKSCNDDAQFLGSLPRDLSHPSRPRDISFGRLLFLRSARHPTLLSGGR
jgi:predicted house-cleaning NTP pyrophosphatase (Maf/HAM1 superfamily)